MNEGHSPEVEVGLRVVRKILDEMKPDAGIARLCAVIPKVGEKMVLGVLDAIIKRDFRSAHLLTHELVWLWNLAPLTCPTEAEEMMKKVEAVLKPRSQI